MNRSRTVLAAAALGAVVLMLVPAAAWASITPGGAGGFGNTYAQTGGIPSDPSSNVCYCHPGVLLNYPATRHGSNLTVANGDPSKIDPTSTAFWPTPTYGNWLRFMPQDIGWVEGAYSGSNAPPTGQVGSTHEYVLRSTLWGPKNTVVTVSTGATFSSPGPTDDVGVISGLEFDHSEGNWLTERGAVSVQAYFQRCGGCHTLGVTRPANATSTIGNNTTITPSTPTSYAALGINCESCHGTGKMSSTHPQSLPWFTLPGVVGAVGGNAPKRALSSDVCGQCHVNGSTSEPRWGSSSSKFSNPNGYTPDVTLAAKDVTNAAQGAYASFTAARLSMETTTNGRATTNFWPSGHNKVGRHQSYFYNEWLESGHAKSRKTILVDMAFLPDFVKSTCLPCHTAEGYLASKGYKSGPFQLAMTSSPATDKLNVECSVCHSTHDTATALGLRMPREDVCQECHTGEIAEGGQATPGEEVQAAQKELLAGYGLIDIPTATAFMPGADCPDCHMPKTAAEFPSHRMAAMLPGDAEAWGVPEGGDSCTPCHPSRTRDELQQYIEGWESDVAAAAADAEAAIDAAKARPASTTPTGVSLINRAYTNQTFTNDPGAATHNYPYVLAGMRKAEAMAKAVGGSVRFGAASSAVNAGGRAYLAGDALFGDSTDAASETVVVEKKTAADPTWVSRAVLTCDADGEFAFAPAQSVTTQYRAFWRASGADRIYAGGTVTVGVRSTTSVNALPSLLLGRSVALKGAVLPAQPGGTARIYMRVPRSTRFVFLSTRVLSSTGYSFVYRPRVRGSHYFYARFSGNANVLGSTSRTIRVLVR
jgi:predicted CXXCH cytochrome family protein